MDGLARSLGLDIEALALELALNDSTPPIQSLPVYMDDEMAEKPADECEKKIDIKELTQNSNFDKIRNYVLMKA